jgi:PilZ domain-containing protein
MAPTPSLQRTLATGDRRGNPRFRISAQLEYTVGRLHGKGVIRDICGRGLFMQIGRTLPVGRPLELLIDWPTNLDGNLRCRLSVKGKVLRSTADGTAVGVLGFECRFDSSRRKSDPPVGPLNG